MNEMMHKGASNPPNYENIIGNLYRSPNNFKRGFSPSVYERALTKEFLNDNINQTSFPEDRPSAKLNSSEINLYNRNISPTPNRRLNLDQPRMSYSPSPINPEMKNENSDLSSYSNYFRDSEETNTKSYQNEPRTIINSGKKNNPILTLNQVIQTKPGSKSYYYQKETKKYIMDESNYDQKQVKYYAPNKAAFQVPYEKNQYYNLSDFNARRATDVSDTFDENSRIHYEQETRHKHPQSGLPWQRDERSIHTKMSKSSFITETDQSMNRLPSSSYTQIGSPFNLRHEFEVQKSHTKAEFPKGSGSSTPTRPDKQKLSSIRFLNITEIGELIAAKERNPQLSYDLTASQHQLMLEAQQYHKNKAIKHKNRPDETVSRADEPKPTTFVSKIDPTSLSITALNIQRSRPTEQGNNPRKAENLKENIGNIERSSYQNPKNRLEIKNIQTKNEGRLSPMQAKEIYSKIINKSPVISSHPLKERLVSPNESMHHEGKINQLNNNIAKSRYNFAEEGENHHGLRHSKSVSKFSSKKGEPSNKQIDVIPILGENKGRSENRSSSEERKKPILQSLQDISSNILQSTKSLFNKFLVPNPRIKCDCSPYLTSNIETCPRAQKWLYTKYKMTELDYLRKTYDKILAEETEAKNKKQIKLDLMRTYPDCKVFENSSDGIKSLEKVLECYSKYDPQIGYVQGINFIVASILYHAEEYIAFWILILIFEKCEMRDIFMNNLPGLTKHCQIIDFLILNNLPDLYSHFCKNGIVVEMFCTEWLCGLFGSVIPIEKMGLFLDYFIENGWTFFYKFVLTLLQTCEKELRRAQDMSEIMLIFKNGINRNQTNNDINLNLNWEQVIKSATRMEMDSSFIYNLHTNFDQNRKTFNLPNSSKA